MSKVVWATALVALMGILIAGLAGCPRPQPPEVGPIMPAPPSGASTLSGDIRIIGSTTVLPLSEVWAKEFGQKNPGVKFSVAGGGSGTGIKALIGKTCNVANSSRKIKSEEIEQGQAGGVNPYEIEVAYDGLVVIVHPDNALAQLSEEQVSQIYAGKLNKWSEVGVSGMGDIITVGRDSASGTFESFKEMALQLHGKAKDLDYRPDMMFQASNQAVLTTVAQTPGAIGYVGLGYVRDSVKVLDIVPMGGGAPTKATAEAVRSGSYPMARGLYMYTDGEPTGVLKAFFDWALSAEGQALVDGTGYIGLQ